MEWGEKAEAGGSLDKAEARFSSCECAELTGEKRESWEEKNLVYKNKKKEKSRLLGGLGVKGEAPAIHLFCFCFLVYSDSAQWASTNLLHTCPFLLSPVTRLPLCSGQSCRLQGGCCCMVKATATDSCLVAPTMNGKKWSVWLSRNSTFKWLLKIQVPSTWH